MGINEIVNGSALEGINSSFNNLQTTYLNINSSITTKMKLDGVCCYDESIETEDSVSVSIFAEKSDVDKAMAQVFVDAFKDDIIATTKKEIEEAALHATPWALLVESELKNHNLSAGEIKAVMDYYNGDSTSYPSEALNKLANSIEGKVLNGESVDPILKELLGGLIQKHAENAHKEVERAGEQPPLDFLYQFEREIKPLREALFALSSTANLKASFARR